MLHDSIYLKTNVMVQPLVDRWYAWTHLVSPATSAMNLRNRHVSILESYLECPSAHAQAAQNPALRGGPFVDYRHDRSEEVRELLRQTRVRAAPRLLFAEEMGAFDHSLARTATGAALNDMYASVPESLKGYVELVYDLRHNPSVRFIEPLLYKSELYDRTSQSLAVSLIELDERPFILSTPVLSDPGQIDLDVAFDDPAVDAIFAAMESPVRFGDIMELFRADSPGVDLVRGLTTGEPPKPYVPYDGPGLRWRYFGHACILIETSNYTCLVDPQLSYTYDSTISRYTYDDLPPRIDCVLITHNHQDHILIETLLRLRRRISRIIVPRNGGGALQDPSIKLALRNIGFHDITEVDDFDEVEFGACSVTAIPFIGEHCDLDVRAKTAYVVRTEGASLAFMSDSCNVQPELYRKVHRIVGDLDVMFVGMECDGAPLSWVYGPLFTQRVERRHDQGRRAAGCNYQQALALVETFRAKHAYVYAMGQEPWFTYISSKLYTETSVPIVESNRLINELRARGVAGERLYGEREMIF